MGGLCCIMKPRSVRPSGAFLRLVRGAVMAFVHCAAPYRPCRLVPVPGLTLSLSEKLVPVPRPNRAVDYEEPVVETVGDLDRERVGVLRVEPLHIDRRYLVPPRFEVANCDLKTSIPVSASLFEVANCDLKSAASSTVN